MTRPPRVLPWWMSLMTVCSVAGLQSVSVFARHDGWLGVWASTESVNSEALILTFPLAVALGAAARAEYVRTGLDLLSRTSGRPRVVILAAVLVEVFAFISLGFLLAVGASFTGTAALSAYGVPDGLAIIAQLAFLFLATSIGLCVGGAARPLVVVPAAGVIAYFGLAFATFSYSDALAALTPYESRSLVGLERISWLYVVCAAWLTALAVSLVLASAGRRRRGIASAWIAAFIALPLAFVGDDNLTVDRMAAETVCAAETHRSSRTVSCVPRAKSFLLDRLNTGFGGLRAQIDPLMPKDLAFVSTESAGIDPALDDSIEAELSRLSRSGYTVMSSADVFDISAYAWPSVRDQQLEFLQVFIPDQRDIVQPQSSLALPAPNTYLRRWLMSQLGAPVDGSAGFSAPLVGDSFFDYEPFDSQIRWFEGLSTSRRDQWLAQHQVDIMESRLTWRAFA